jgi:hypothetical protein
MRFKRQSLRRSESQRTSFSPSGAGRRDYEIIHKYRIESGGGNRRRVGSDLY